MVCFGLMLKLNHIRLLSKYKRIPYVPCLLNNHGSFMIPTNNSHLLHNLSNVENSESHLWHSFA